MHAITHSRPDISVTPAIWGDSLGTLDNPENIWILGNPSKLCSFCNVGRHSPSQSGQSLSASSAFSSPPATPAIAAFLGGNLCSPGNPGRQFPHFFSIWACNHPFLAGNIGNPGNLADSFGDLDNLGKICILGTPINLCSLCNGGRQSPSQSQQSWSGLSQSRTENSTPSTTPPITAFLGGSFCSLGNPGWRSCQVFHFRHAISHSRAAMSVIPATSVDTLGDLGLQNQQSRHSQQPQRARQSWPAISVAMSTILVRTFAISDWKFDTLSNTANLGIFGRQSRQSRPATSPFFLISACNHPFSAGNIGNTGNLGRQSRRSRQSCQYLHSLQFQQSRQSLRYPPTFSVAILALSVCKFGNLITLSSPANLGIFGRQPVPSRQSRPATSSIFLISACNHPFSAGKIGNPGNLGR